MFPRVVTSQTPPHSPSSTGMPVSTDTLAQWSLHTSGMFAGKSLACMYAWLPWPSVRRRQAHVRASTIRVGCLVALGRRRTDVRREDEPELQSDGEAAAAQDGEAKDNDGKDDNEDDSEDEDKKKGEDAEEGAEGEGQEEEEKPRVALPRPVFPNLVRTPPNPILRK